MTTFTRAGIQQLTSDQQEVIGRMEVRRLHSRQRLVERARRNRSSGIWAVLFAGFVAGLAVFCIHSPSLLPFVIIAVIWLIGFHITGLNRRLDALMDLLELDARKTAEKEPAEK